MIGSGLVGFLLTCIIIAAAIYILYALINPAPIPANLKLATYILIFIILLIWLAKVALPLMGMAL